MRCGCSLSTLLQASTKAISLRNHCPHGPKRPPYARRPFAWKIRITFVERCDSACGQNRSSKVSPLLFDSLFCFGDFRVTLVHRCFKQSNTGHQVANDVVVTALGG